MRDDEKDERKNFFISENFSALHALNSDDMHDDDDDYEYPIFDHIGKCRFMLPRTHPDFGSRDEKSTPEAKRGKQTKTGSVESASDATERRGEEIRAERARG